MSKKLLLLLLFIASANLSFAQIKAVSVKSVPKSTQAITASDVVCGREFTTMLKDDILRLYTVSINSPLGKMNPRPAPVIKVENDNDYFLVEIINKDDIKMNMIIPGLGSVSFPYKKQDYKDYNAVTFNSTTDQVNKMTPLILIAKKSLLKSSAIKKILSNSENFDLAKLKATLQEQGLSNEDIDVIYYINGRKSSETK